ncbi:hypothetical protein [Thermovibrio sp.]
MNFGDFNLDKAKELIGGAKELDSQTLVKLLENMVKNPEKGSQVVEGLKSESSGGNIIETIQKLYSLAKKFGLL